MEFSRNVESLIRERQKQKNIKIAYFGNLSSFELRRKMVREEWQKANAMRVKPEK